MTSDHLRYSRIHSWLKTKVICRYTVDVDERNNMNLNIYTDLSLHGDHVPADVRTPLRASLDCDFKHKIKCTVESIRCDQKTKTKKHKQKKETHWQIQSRRDDEHDTEGRKVLDKWPFTVCDGFKASGFNKSFLQGLMRHWLWMLGTYEL